MKLHRLCFMFLASLAWCLFAHAATSADVAGSYAAVSESEWALDVDLHGDGTAKISITTWAAGNYKNRVARDYAGRWLVNGTTITVQGEAGQVIFNFEPNLSFKQFGGTGNAAGLVTSSATFEQSTFTSGRQLWLKHKLPGR